MLRVSDLMTHSVVTLLPEMTLAQAAATLSTIGVTGAPVCDEEGRLIGVFSQSDVVKLDESIVEGARVADTMTRAVHTVRASDPLQAALGSMATHGVHRLPVLDDEGHLAGIITPMDVVRAIASGRMQVPALDR